MASPKVEQLSECVKAFFFFRNKVERAIYGEGSLCYVIGKKMRKMLENLINIRNGYIHKSTEQTT